jgi:aminoglycoside phosphotransferase (APT) family kinase protein
MINGFDLPERAREKLRKRLPNCGPYTLTNGGLDFSNIIVDSGHLVGIISWETAGYFPVWWEWVRASIAHGEEDNEWKGMLRERMEPFPEADEFYKDLYALGEELFRTRFPRMDERKQQLMKRLMEE